MNELVRYNHARDGVLAFDGWAPMRLFSNLLSWDPFATRSGLRVEDYDDHIVVKADMPGVDHDAIEATLTAGTLTLSGKRGEREYRYSCTLGSAVDASRIEATLENGELTVVAHKFPGAKPRRIPIVVKNKQRGSKRRFFFRKKS